MRFSCNAQQKKHFKRTNVLWALVTFRITVLVLVGVLCYSYIGSLTEWTNVPVLKTGDLKGSGGSNPSASAQELTVDSFGEMFTKNCHVKDIKSSVLCVKQDIY